MKREEIQASIEFSRNSKAHRLRCRNFEKGAEWADKTMLDRACKWLAEHISPEEIYEYETDETPTTYLTVNLHDNMFDFINDFRQAMEGGAE